MTVPGSSGNAVVEVLDQGGTAEDEIGRGGVLPELVVDPGAQGQVARVAQLVGGDQLTGRTARGSRRTSRR